MEDLQRNQEAAAAAFALEIERNRQALEEKEHEARQKENAMEILMNQNQQSLQVNFKLQTTKHKPKTFKPKSYIAKLKTIFKLQKSFLPAPLGPYRGGPRY